MSRIFIIIVLFMLLLYSCDNSTDPEDSSKQLTITFTDDWLCSSCGEGILYYSKTDGSLLWSGSWTGNDTLQINIKNIPNRASITTVTSDESGSNIDITTNYGIVPASWTFKGQPPYETAGSVTLEFQNIPEHQGYIIASSKNRRSSLYRTVSSPFTKDITTSPDDMYIRLNTTANGPLYMWLEDVSAGETRTIDLANLQPLQSKEIALPSTDEETSVSVRGFFNQDYYSGYYDIDYIYGLNSDVSSDTYTAYYPTGLFPEYSTQVYIDEEPFPTYNLWSHMVLGNIPGTIQKINADFEFIDTHPTNFEINATGDFNATGSYWEYEDGNGNSFNWNVYSSAQKYKLPELPDAVTTKYPGLNRDLFTLINADITKHIGIQSQDELLEKMFQQGIFYYNFVQGQLRRSKDPEGLR